MERQQQNFLEIIKSAVHHTPFCLNEPVDYNAILELAREQNLLALVCEKLCESGEFLASEAYGQAIADTVAIVAGQASRTEAFLDLYRKFEEAGIQPVVMKGIVCRELYGEFRDHRPSGDEDLLIRPEDFPTMQNVMENRGFQMEWEKVSEQELEVLQEITFDDQAVGLHIEVHTNLMGLETGFLRRMNEYFTDAFERKVPIQIDDIKLWTMNPTDHFLFLVFHAFKHLMSGGIGVRQAMDIFLFGEAYSEKIDWSYIHRCLRETEAEKFFGDLLFIGNRYLGYECEAGQKPNCPEVLLTDMLENGVFGNSTQAEMTANSMTTAAVNQRESYTTSKSILRAIFPNIEVIRAVNPELVEKPWLLPLCWVKRWGRFIRHNKENGGNLAQESIRISQRRIALLKKYGVIR